MVVFNRWIPFRGYAAINLFGIIFARRGVEVTPSLLNHERIHTRQQWEMLWIPFYLWYVAEYLFFLIKYRNSYRAYRSVRFEREAYAHDHDLNYLKHRRLFAWARMKRGFSSSE